MNFSKIDTMTETYDTVIDSLAQAEEQSMKLWRTDGDIHKATDLWCTHRAEAEEKYGHISDWDVSSVTDMSHLFNCRTVFEDMRVHQKLSYRGRDSFNEDLSHWDVSKVTNMEGMFTCAFLFNKPIGDWDVSDVTNMCAMFAGAFAFNQAIEDWDVSKVTDMSCMFSGAYAFNRSIENWDMSNVTNMDHMF